MERYDEITKCSYERILRKSKVSFNMQVNLKEVQLHLGNAGISLH